MVDVGGEGPDRSEIDMRARRGGFGGNGRGAMPVAKCFSRAYT